MNKKELKKAIKRIEKNSDDRVEFFRQDTLTGIIFGGEYIGPYTIENKLTAYCIYFGNICIVFDDFEVRSI